MAWADSKIFVSTMEDALENTTALDLNSDSFKAALFNNSVTPSQTVASAATAYNTGVWTTGNELSDGAEWPAAGEILASVTFVAASNVLTFDAADRASTGSSATLTAVYGTLVYDDTLTTPVADQGLCYNYFGGTNSVTDGSFTIVWNASGILSLTL